MNISEVKTSDKIMMTLRLSPEVYKAVMIKVRSEKDKENNRAYSINQYLTELIEKDLDIKKTF